MADWFIATEGVKVVKDSASLWPQIFTAGAAFGGVWYGQWLITQREAKAASGKRDEERLYISTELVFFAGAVCRRLCKGSYRHRA